jgi:hypothetical protein
VLLSIAAKYNCADTGFTFRGERREKKREILMEVRERENGEKKGRFKFLSVFLKYVLRSVLLS